MHHNVHDLMAAQLKTAKQYKLMLTDDSSIILLSYNTDNLSTWSCDTVKPFNFMDLNFRGN